MSLRKLIKEPTEIGWLEMLEDERKSINPHLDRLTLRKLGSLRLFSGYASPSPAYVPSSKQLGDDDPEIVASKGLSLATQGIFIPGNYSRFVTTEYQGHIWGISRSGRWILAKVKNVFEEHESATTDGSFDRYARVVKVEIAFSSIEEIVAGSVFSAYNHWDFLVAAIKRLIEERRQRHAEFEAYAEGVELEDRVVSVLLKDTIRVYPLPQGY